MRLWSIGVYRRNTIYKEAAPLRSGEALLEMYYRLDYLATQIDTRFLSFSL